MVDNGSSHRGTAANERLSAAYPNAQLVCLLIHASWLNQIEIYFSVVQRKVLTPDDFCSLDELARRLLNFQGNYQEIARPFAWRFTKADLHALLARIEAHRPTASDHQVAAWALRHRNCAPDHEWPASLSVLDRRGSR